MADPIDLSEVRRAKKNADYDGLTCLVCGGIWFKAVVTLDQSMMVTGGKIPTCDNCGESL